MSNGDARLNYNLAKGVTYDAESAVVIGGDWEGVTAAATAASIDVSAQIPANQAVEAGDYSGTVIFTVSYDFAG